mgnify:CR=1 FL=1
MTLRRPVVAAGGPPGPLGPASPARGEAGKAGESARNQGGRDLAFPHRRGMYCVTGVNAPATNAILIAPLDRRYVVTELNIKVESNGILNGTCSVFGHFDLA